MHNLLLFLPSDLVRQVGHIEALCLSQSRECRKFKTFQGQSIVTTHIAWTLYYGSEKGLSYNLRLRTNIVSSTLLLCQSIWGTKDSPTLLGLEAIRKNI